MQKIVTAINAISSQPWAFAILIVGVVTLVFCKKTGIDTTVAGGIIGVASNMFTSSISKSHTVDGGTSQDTVTPGVVANPKL